MWSTAVPDELDEVPPLRHDVLAYLAEHAAEADLDAIGLLFSELVSNAVRHADGPRTAHVRVEPDVVRIEVIDASPVEPVVLPAEPTRVGGNGMRIVAAMSSSWGVDHLPAGKVVWFEVPARAS